MTTSKAGFKRFEFFDVESLSIIQGGGQNQISINPVYKLNCGASESGTIVFGDNCGQIFLLDGRFFNQTESGNGGNANQNFDKRHKLFRKEIMGLSIIHDSSCKFGSAPKQYVIALGDEGKSSSPSAVDNVEEEGFTYGIKIASLSDFSKPIAVINATLSSLIVSNALNAVVTAFAVMQDGSQIAVGYSNGAILLLYLVPVSALKDLRDSIAFAAGSMNNAFTATFLLTYHFAPVSALHFAELPVQPQTSHASHRRLIRLFATFDTTMRDKMEQENISSPKVKLDPSVYGEEVDAAGIVVFDTSTFNGMVAMNNNSAKVLDDRGATSHCSTYTRGTCELVVGRSEAIYNYSVEDRGAAMAVFGEKISLCAVGRYTLIANMDEKSTTDVAASGTTLITKPRKTIINIFDLKNKIICGTAKKYQLPVNEKILFAFSDSSTIAGTVYIVTAPSFTIIRFKEKETRKKIDVLLNASKPPLYSLAILLAAEEQLDPAEIMALYKTYGDYFYENNEFDSAMNQYCHTIGYVAPSYVVMKFLDPYRITNLVMYLEKLHEKGLAAKEHNNLLLACYTKIKDDAKISWLLSSLLSSAPPPAHVRRAKNSSTSLEVSSESSKFDPKQTITLLSNAGYTENALQVALKYHEHVAYLDMQLSKSPPQVDDALSYIAYLAFVDPYPQILDGAVRRYGRLLLRSEPRLFTSVLLRLCTGDYKSLLSHPGGGAGFFQPSVSGGDSSSALLAGLLSSEAVSPSSTSGPPSPLPAGAASSSIVFPKLPLAVVDYIYLFTDFQEHLLALLAGVADHLKSAGRLLSHKLVSTLLELYLTKHQREAESLKAVASNPSSSESLLRDLQKAVAATDSCIMGLLDGPYSSQQYDPAHAMLLMKASGFTSGVKFLLEKQQHYKPQSVDLLMRMSMERNDTAEIFKLLRREGGKDPELYVQALTYMVGKVSVESHSSPAASPNKNQHSHATKKHTGDSDSDDEEEEDDENDSDDSDGEDGRWDDVEGILELVQKENILPTTQVITILSTHPRLPLKIMLPYIKLKLEESTDAIAHLEECVISSMDNLEKESRKRLDQIHAKPVKAVEKPNTNPFVGEEYDEDAEEEAEELRLAEEREQEKWNSIRRAQLECSQDHELFYKELELGHADGFNTVAAFFGKSIIS